MPSGWCLQKGCVLADALTGAVQTSLFPKSAEFGKLLGNEISTQPLPGSCRKDGLARVSRPAGGFCGDEKRCWLAWGIWHEDFATQGLKVGRWGPFV